ncbi:MAG: sigma-70 family RNA polymerase sigma factor [Bacteroidetes bacterium]|nr:sigma-70 family RNA polymerase sigma factor [Bacteroidota bacterium]
MHELQDTDIVQSVLLGDKTRYAILVERYQSFVFTIIGRLIPTREEAEDVAQEVFVKAYLSLAGFKGNSKFSTWLYTIAHTTAISHLRKNRIEPLFVDDEKLSDYLDNKQHTVNNTNTQDQRTAINNAIKQLAADDAEIITLFYLAGQSTEEIAAITNLEINNIKVKLHRARQKLKDIVERTYGKEAQLLYREQ